MKEIIKRGATSNILRVFLQDSASTTGAGKTALTSASSGLIISTIADLEATATTYTSAATNVETITTLGTFAAPTAGKCRFREVDATNFPGVYEIHIADARFNVTNATQLLISIQCTGVAPVYVEYQLVAVDLMDTVRFGLTALPNTAVTTNGSLITAGTGTAQLSVSSGLVTAGSISNGAITTSTFAAGAINSAAIADGAIDAATFADSALVIGSGAAGGVKAYLDAGSITAGVVATGAIDADAIASAAITSAKFAGGAITATVIADGAIDSATFAAGAINAAAIADAAIDAATFADSALVIGSGSGLGVKAYLDTNSITAGVIATDAIDSDAIANSAITIRMSGDGTPSEGRIIAGSIANDVWNAATASYTTAGTFGKLMDILKKANFVIEGTTVAGSTTTSINTGLTGYLTDAFKNQTILFISGALAGTSSLIITSSSGGGVFTLDGALPAAPASGVDFVVLGTHVHGTQEIANVTWTTDISGISVTGQAGRYVTDGAVAASNASAAASVIEGVAYRENLADVLLGRNIAGGSNAGRLVKDALRALRNKSAIVGTTLTVYAEDDTTAAWTAAVSSSATADPVTGIDPA